ncbi:MAG: VWA domain-containing protein, partial [Planctomycetaceae bacterium]
MTFPHTSTLVFLPLIPPAYWALLTLIAAGLLGWYAWRRPRGISTLSWGTIVGLMGAAVALVLGLLLNPVWRERIPPPPGKPRLAILVDSSASMAATDMPDGKSRYAVAVQTARETAASLADRFDVETAVFAHNVLKSDLSALDRHTPGGMTTDLAAAIASSVEPAHAAGQALLLLSDGNHNAEGGTAQVISTLSLERAADAAISTKTLGTLAQSSDFSIRLQTPQQLAFIGQTISVTA